ncbi:MAG: undecaprenyl diphosphate synthase family protein, partial [Candidatus Doudnabacteria bacterium]
MKKVPKHLAIIPDGNRRWAKAHRFLPWQGHEVGVERIFECIEAAFREGVEHVTVWTGSYSNLESRTAKEVAVLFMLMQKSLSNPKLLK